MPPLYKPMKDFAEIASFFQNKCGIEIGGPSVFFKTKGFMPVYKKAKSIDVVNFASNTVWTGETDSSKGFVVNKKRIGNSYIFDAVDFTSIKNNSYDFVLSCNNIEHIANPIKAIEQWLSVLKNEGVLVIVAPRKEVNFDHKREITEFSHLMDDYKNNITENDLSHLDEILRNHDLTRDTYYKGTIEDFKERSLKNFENRCLHHHVFDLNVLIQIFEYFQLSVIKSIQLTNDYVIIGKK